MTEPIKKEYRSELEKAMGWLADRNAELDPGQDALAPAGWKWAWAC